MKRTDRDELGMSARNLRLDARLKGYEVAARMGTTPVVVSHFERRHGNPSAGTVIRFLRAVDRDDLAEHVETAAAALAAARQGREPRTPALFTYFRLTCHDDLARLMQAVSKRALVWDLDAEVAAETPAATSRPTRVPRRDWSRQHGPVVDFLRQFCTVHQVSEGERADNGQFTAKRRLFKVFSEWQALSGTETMGERFFLYHMGRIPGVATVRTVAYTNAFNVTVHTTPQG